MAPTSNAIHGNKSQGQRERALGEFKQGKVKVLIATDIAARGIDVSGVSHVINFELPNVAEQYVHRIGRTARAGASGIAVAFCADDEKAYLRDIERITRQKVTVRPLPDDFVNLSNQIKQTRVKTMGADPEVRIDRPRDPARPRATHAPRATGTTGRNYAGASRGGQGGGGQGGGGGRPQGGGRPGGQGGGRPAGGGRPGGQGRGAGPSSAR
jgi:ATP-dependent RNA helicase RhlE